MPPFHDNTDDDWANADDVDIDDPPEGLYFNDFNHVPIEFKCQVS